MSDGDQGGARLWAVEPERLSGPSVEAFEAAARTGDPEPISKHVTGAGLGVVAAGSIICGGLGVLLGASLLEASALVCCTATTCLLSSRHLANVIRDGPVRRMEAAFDTIRLRALGDIMAAHDMANQG